MRYQCQSLRGAILRTLIHTRILKSQNIYHMVIIKIITSKTETSLHIHITYYTQYL